MIWSLLWVKYEVLYYIQLHTCGFAQSSNRQRTVSQNLQHESMHFHLISRPRAMVGKHLKNIKEIEPSSFVKILSNLGANKSMIIVKVVNLFNEISRLACLNQRCYEVGSRRPIKVRSQTWPQVYNEEDDEAETDGDTTNDITAEETRNDITPHILSCQTHILQTHILSISYLRHCTFYINWNRSNSPYRCYSSYR